MSIRIVSALSVVAPLSLVVVALACGDGGGSEPIIPGTPNGNNGSGGSGGGDGGSGFYDPTTGSGGDGAGAPMPNPGSEWSQFGAPHQLRAEIQVVAEDQVYAVAGDPLEVGDVIARFNGATWASMTDGRAGLRHAFAYIPPLEALEPDQFVAVVSNHLELWDGLDWNVITLDALGLQAGLHYVDIDNIYAPVGQQIQLWDGLLDAWVPVTEDVPEPYVLTRAFHWVSDLEIYAVAANGLASQVLMWDGTWQPFSDPIEGLKPEIHFVSPTEIYAVIGTQICIWDGTQWSPWTDELAGLQTAFSFMGGDDIYAIAGLDRVWHWGL